MMSSERNIDLKPYLEKEYEIDCAGTKVKLKPIKAWVFAPKGRKGVIVGLFRCPDGKSIRRAIGKVE